MTTHQESCRNGKVWLQHKESRCCLARAGTLLRKNAMRHRVLSQTVTVPMVCSMRQSGTDPNGITAPLNPYGNRINM